MKTKFALCALILNAAFVTASHAAQDQSLIQTTRKNQLAYDAKKEQIDATKTGQAEQVKPAQKPATKLVLPLDHGPHAVVTPWVNEQRRLRAAEQEKADAAAPVSEARN